MSTITAPREVAALLSRPWLTVYALVGWWVVTWFALHGAALRVLNAGRFDFVVTSTTPQILGVALVLSAALVGLLMLRVLRGQTWRAPVVAILIVVFSVAGTVAYAGSQLNEGHVTRPARLAAWLIGNQLYTADLVWNTNEFGRYVMLRPRGSAQLFDAVNTNRTHQAISASDGALESETRVAN